MKLPIPAELEQAIELADRLGVLPELVSAVQAVLTGDLGRSRLAAETAAIKAAARLPYVANGGAE